MVLVPLTFEINANAVQNMMLFLAAVVLVTCLTVVIGHSEKIFNVGSSRWPSLRGGGFRFQISIYFFTFAFLSFGFQGVRED